MFSIFLLMKGIFWGKPYECHLGSVLGFWLSASEDGSPFVADSILAIHWKKGPGA